MLGVCVAELLVIAVLIIRLARGPTVSDRIIALNTMSTQAAIAVLFFAAYAGRSIYCDVALWLASFSYLGAFVWALVFGLYIWLGGLAVGVAGGTAFIFGALIGFLVFLLVMAYGAVPEFGTSSARRSRWASMLMTPTIAFDFAAAIPRKVPQAVSCPPPRTSGR